MELNNKNLQAAAESIAANMNQISELRAQVADTDMNEVAQQQLIDKFDLSQTEAAEIVEDLKSGLTMYATTYTSMKDDAAGTVISSLEKATEGMNADERVRYLASLLSALELAKVNKDADQSAIDRLLEDNLNKSEAELTDAIVLGLDNLPLEALTQAIEEITPDSVKNVAEAIEKNSEDFRFMAALQLYILHREGTLKLNEEDQKLNPRLIGALASGAVDAMIATSNLKANKISLKDWQYVIKVIAGTLFAVAATCLAVIGMLGLSLPIMLLIWSVLGTGFFATLTMFVILIPILQYGAEKASDLIVGIMEKLSPIYDRLVVKITAFFKTIYDKISVWVKAKYGEVKERFTTKQEEDAVVVEEETAEESATISNDLLPA